MLYAKTPNRLRHHSQKEHRSRRGYWQVGGQGISLGAEKCLYIAQNPQRPVRAVLARFFYKRVLSIAAST